jgi:hypothetical protein
LEAALQRLDELDDGQEWKTALLEGNHHLIKCSGEDMVVVMHMTAAKELRKQKEELKKRELHRQEEAREREEEEQRRQEKRRQEEERRQQQEEIRREQIRLEEEVRKQEDLRRQEEELQRQEELRKERERRRKEEEEAKIKAEIEAQRRRLLRKQSPWTIYNSPLQLPEVIFFIIFESSDGALWSPIWRTFSSRTPCDKFIAVVCVRVCLASRNRRPSRTHQIHQIHQTHQSHQNSNRYKSSPHQPYQVRHRLTGPSRTLKNRTTRPCSPSGTTTATAL